MKTLTLNMERTARFCFVALAVAAAGCVSQTAIERGANGAPGRPMADGNPGQFSNLTNASPGESAQAPGEFRKSDDARELTSGDHLSFQIVEDHEDAKQLVVSDSREVDVPYLGHVSVAGLTSKSLAQYVKKELEEKYYYHATVMISVEELSRTLGKIYASGALRNPGPQVIPGDEEFTLSKAVLCAGGFADFADKGSVRVTRKSPTGTNECFTVDVGKILERGRTDLDLALKPGDMVFVPERVVRF